jgi:hypothetical protein
MRRRNKLLLIAGCLVFACGLVVLLFWHEVQVAYHRSRLLAATDNYGLLCWQPVRTVTKLEALKILTFRMTAQKEQEAMERHKDALLRLGYFRTQEFVLTNQNIKDNWALLHTRATNTFTRNQWWAIQLLETNHIVVVAASPDLRRWEQLISELDR